jgi:hypothetical protein
MSNSSSLRYFPITTSRPGSRSIRWRSYRSARTSTPGSTGSPLDRFDDDERHLLATFARSLNFNQAATDLGITPKALRSRLERLKARQSVALAGS